MKNFTIIRNELFGPSQLSIGARYLHCLLLKYCGKDDYCYPSQITLAKDMDISDRQIRNLLKELIQYGLVFKERRGWNRSNTYKVAKAFILDRTKDSFHLGSLFPLHQGDEVPPKSTYLKAKGKRSIKSLEHIRETLIRKGLK